MARSINENIRKIREIKGYSQSYVARKLGTDQEVVSYMETKQKDIPEEIYFNSLSYLVLVLIL
jgi:transcriptional regulator with XRE-family HTH domain